MGIVSIRWRKGSESMSVKSGVVLSELKRIANKHQGILHAEDVVDEAKNPRSVLHPIFDWNDTVAASNWRLYQARHLISVSVLYLEGNDEKPYKVFVSLSEDRHRGEGGYRSLESVMSNKRLRQILLTDALNEMELFREKYFKLKELGEVFKAMNKVRIKLGPKQEEMQTVTVRN